MRRRSTRPGLASLLLAMLALVGLLARGVSGPSAAQPTGSLAAPLAVLGATICHSDAGTPDDPAPAPAHTPECALCTLCQALTQAAVLLDPSAIPPASRAAAAGRVAFSLLPAPPAAEKILTTAWPRGPPSLA